MPHNDDYHRLYHIWTAAMEAVHFAHGCTREDLEVDRKLQHTFIHLLSLEGLI